METPGSDVIKRLLREGNSMEPGAQPAVLMNHNIDHTRVAEYQACHLNDSWAPQIKEFLDNGFIVFRIQTELGFDGHNTMIYLAKMKTN